MPTVVTVYKIGNGPAAIGVDPLTPEGIARWAREATAVYTKGAFVTAPGKEPS